MRIDWPKNPNYIIGGGAFTQSILLFTDNLPPYFSNKLRITDGRVVLMIFYYFRLGNIEYWVAPQGYGTAVIVPVGLRPPN